MFSGWFGKTNYPKPKVYDGNLISIEIKKSSTSILFFEYDSYSWHVTIRKEGIVETYVGQGVPSPLYIWVTDETPIRGTMSFVVNNVLFELQSSVAYSKKPIDGIVFCCSNEVLELLKRSCSKFKFLYKEGLIYIMP